MFILFVVFCCSLVNFSKGEQCGIEVFHEIRRCDNLWGYHSENLFNPNGEVYDIRQLITHCRNPDRVDIGQCVRSAYDGCDPGWTAEKAVFYEETIQLLGQAVNYICSGVEVLEGDRDCLVGISDDIAQCQRDGMEQFQEQFGALTRESDEVPWDRNKELLKRLGQHNQLCVYDLVGQQCSADSATMFGNFFYATGVHIYDEENRRHR